MSTTIWINDSDQPAAEPIYAKITKPALRVSFLEERHAASAPILKEPVYASRREISYAPIERRKPILREPEVMSNIPNPIESSAQYAPKKRVSIAPDYAFVEKSKTSDYATIQNSSNDYASTEDLGYYSPSQFKPVPRPRVLSAPPPKESKTPSADSSSVPVPTSAPPPEVEDAYAEFKAREEKELYATYAKNPRRTGLQTRSRDDLYASFKAPTSASDLKVPQESDLSNVASPKQRKESLAKKLGHKVSFKMSALVRRSRSMAVRGSAERESSTDATVVRFRRPESPNAKSSEARPANTQALGTASNDAASSGSDAASASNNASATRQSRYTQRRSAREFLQANLQHARRLVRDLPEFQNLLEALLATVMMWQKRQQTPHPIASA